MIPYWYSITSESSICTKSCLTLQGLVCLETVSSIASFLLLVEWDLDQLWLCGFCLFSLTMRYVSVGLKKKVPSFSELMWTVYGLSVLFYNFGLNFFFPVFFFFSFFTVVTSFWKHWLLPVLLKYWVRWLDAWEAWHPVLGRTVVSAGQCSVLGVVLNVEWEAV